MQYAMESQNVLTGRGANGAFSQLNLGHWLKVKAELPANAPRRTPAIVPAFRVGQQLFDKANGVAYEIESLQLAWYAGYYLHAVLRTETGSHCVAVLENYSCLQPDVVRKADQDKKNFEVF